MASETQIREEIERAALGCPHCGENVVIALNGPPNNPKMRQITVFVAQLLSYGVIQLGRVEDIVRAATRREVECLDEEGRSSDEERIDEEEVDQRAIDRALVVGTVLLLLAVVFAVFGCSAQVRVESETEQERPNMCRRIDGPRDPGRWYLCEIAGRTCIAWDWSTEALVCLEANRNGD